MTDQRTTYRNYHIRYDPPPVPSRAFDWSWHHDDYDGAPDSNDNRCGHSRTLNEAKAAIDAQLDEQE